MASTGKGNKRSHSGSAFDWHHLPSLGVRVRGFNGRRVYVCRLEVDHAAHAFKEGMHKCGMKIFFVGACRLGRREVPRVCHLGGLRHALRVNFVIGADAEDFNDV